MEEKTVVEIHGIKMEVDMRSAKRIETFKVGDPVKILVKPAYTTDYRSFPGIIVGFDQFQKLPTIVVAYMDVGYTGADLKFEYINAQSKEIEIVSANELDLPVEKNHILAMFDRQIDKAKADYNDALRKRNYFLTQFGRYFAEELEVAEDFHP